MRTSFKKITSVFLAVLMLVSVVSVMGVSAAETDKSVTGSSTVVLDASFCDEGGYAEWYAWTWSGENEGHWVQASSGTSSSDITYEGIEENVIFARMNPAKSLPSWNNDSDSDIVWNQTGNLTVDGGTFVIDSWGEGWGADLQGHWDGDAPLPPDPDPGSYTVKLDPGFAAGSGDWYAWTWIDQGPHWVTGSESGGIITFENICDNVIFANFYDYPDSSWTGKIGQTTDLYAEDGKTYVIGDVDTAEDGTDLYYGEWTDGTIITEPDTNTEVPEPTTAPIITTAPPINTDPVPTTVPGPTVPTDPTAADEDQYLYVSVKSNVNIAGSKVKTNGDTITVSYSLKTPEKIDDGQFTVSYDNSKLELSSQYNTQTSMFPVAADTNYNLGAGNASVKFNFSGTNGKYDFTNGATLVNLVFTRKTDAVGTALVYLDVVDLNSKDNTYVDNSEVKTSAGLAVSQTVSDAAVAPPVSEDVKPAVNPNVVIKASSNISSEVQTINCDKTNVKVTYKMTVPEIVAFGKGVVTYDSSKLALESKYNSQSSMFTTLNTQTNYNLNAGTGTMMFSFTSADPVTKSGTFDFRTGADVISLIFTVKDGAAGEADVYLDLMDLGSFDTDYIEGGKPTDNVTSVTSNIVLEAQVATTAVPDTTDVEDSTPIFTDIPTTPSGVVEPTTTAEPSTGTPVQPTTAPTPKPTTNPTKPTTAPVKPSNNVGKGTKVAAAEKFVLALKNDKDPKGSAFNGLKAQVKKSGVKKNSLKVSWSKVKNAKGYIVFGNKCGSKYKKLKTVKGTSFTQKKLKKGTYYKYLIMAYDKNNKIISTSKTIHVATKGGTVGNYKKVKLNKTSRTIKKGKTFKLKATCVKQSKKLTVKNHRKVKYESTNTKIATVTSGGKIKAKKKGKCYVYAYAQNGVYKRIKITVK